MQAGVRELHLGLNPDRADDPKSIGTLSEVLQQCGFPDPRLAAHDDDAAVVLARTRQQPVERLGLGAPAPQPKPAAVGVEHALGELISCLTEPWVSRQRA